MLVVERVSLPRETGGRRHAVYARLSVFEGSPDQIDEGRRQAREQVMPRAKQMDGFKRMIALGDRQSGKTVG